MTTKRTHKNPKKRSRNKTELRTLPEVQKALQDIESQNVSNRIAKLESVLNEVSHNFVQNLVDTLHSKPVSAPSCNISISIEQSISFIKDFRGVRDRKTGEIIYSLDRGLSWLNDTIYKHAKLIAKLFEFENQVESFRNYQILVSCLRYQMLAAVLEAHYTPRSQHANQKPLICTNALKYPKFLQKLKEFGLSVNVDIKQLPTALRNNANKFYHEYVKLKLNRDDMPSQTIPPLINLPPPHFTDCKRKTENETIKHLKSKVRDWEIKYKLLQVEHQEMQNGLAFMSQHLTFLRQENEMLTEENCRLKQMQQNMENLSPLNFPPQHHKVEFLIPPKVALNPLNPLLPVDNQIPLPINLNFCDSLFMESSAPTEMDVDVFTAKNLGEVFDQTA